jgi:hypothetical protein
MQTVYRVNTIAGYKPWRSGGPYLLTDKAVFDMIVDCSKDDYEFYQIPGAARDEDGFPIDEDNTLSEWLYEHCKDEIEMPYILADEITFYVE